MPAFSALMRRLGYVKLTRYGLALTAEGRIMTLRHDVLDDGYGGKIVGWLDRDLAATELTKWEAAKPAPQRAVATPVATKPVAPAVEADEDDWEWTIALARARAAAEEAEIAAKVMISAPVLPRRTRQDTVPPPPVSSPMIARDPIDSGEWPKTEPLGNIDYEDYSTEVRAIRIASPPPPIPAKPAQRPTPPARVAGAPARPLSGTGAIAKEPSRPIAIAKEPSRPIAIAKEPSRPIAIAKEPSTIIPVPRLPRITDTMPSVQPPVLEPVVASPRRAPKGTPAPRITGVTPPPAIRPDPDRPYAGRAAEDATKPGIALPPVARPLPQIPGIKRTAPRG